MERCFCLINNHIIDGKEYNKISRLGNSISDSEFCEISKELKYYYNDTLNKDIIYSVLYSNIVDFHQMISNYNNLSSELSMYSDFYYLTIQVKKHISNIVTSFWTYDYHYCDKVKKKPDEYSHFLEARSKEYENNKDYRLINILRHYIQHIDFPEININNLVDQESVVLDIRIVKRNLYKLNLDTHEIDTLNSFQDTINVVDVVNSFQDSMKRIHYVLSNIVKDAFIKEIPILTGYLRNNILSNIGKYDKIGIVTFDQESDKKALQLQISWIPNEIIELVKDD